VQKPTDPDDYELEEEYDLSKLRVIRRGRYAVAAQDSPLDVEGVDLGLTAEEILQFVREGRHSSQGASE